MAWRPQQHNGRPIPFYKQDYGDSCALACVAMVLKAVTRSSPTERSIMNIFSNAPRSGTWEGRPVGAYEAAERDRVRGSRLTYAQADPGTTTEGVIAYLNGYGVNAKWETLGQREWSKLIAATVDRPRILYGSVGQRKHFVVCYGLSNPADEYSPFIIADPFFDNVERATTTNHSACKLAYQNAVLTLDVGIVISLI